MIRLFVLAIFSSLLSVATAKEGDTILIHFVGQVNKPGAHRVSAKPTMDQLKEACGGLTEYGSTKRMVLIRFPRLEGSSEDLQGRPDTRKDEILRGDKIPKEGERFVLREGDLIYIPMKYVIGR